MEIKTIRNKNGKTIRYANAGIIEKDGLFFKDLEGDGVLYPYNDHRLKSEERAKDLAYRLDIKEALGLMLHSPHQSSPSKSDSYYGEVTYNGKQLKEIVYDGQISDQQIDWIENGHLRHVLITSIKDNALFVKWVNNIQSLCETRKHGIPVNLSSDPRHGTTISFEYDAGANGDISHWPEAIGLAAAFDPELVKEFGRIGAKEYRALGFATTLGPQADVASEPRWSRISGTFGESIELDTDIVKAYIDGFQGEEFSNDSVIAMVKHFPGAGPSEKGRNSHYPSGKNCIYPNNGFENHLKPFVEGAFSLNGNTGKAMAVMPSYAITVGYGEQVGAAFSKDIITGLLREKLNYDEVVCTDWSLLKDEAEPYSFMGGRCWGVENLNETQRLAKLILAGNDQFGGISDYQLLSDAYGLLVKEYGADAIDKLIRESARRCLLNMFRIGLFEDPYPRDDFKDIVSSKDYVEAGLDAQRKSLILVKNKDKTLPLKKNSKAFIPDLKVQSSTDWLGNKTDDDKDIPAVEKALADNYLELVELKDADAVIAYVRMPGGEVDSYDGYHKSRGYVPISLQYEDYKADGKYGYESDIAYSMNKSDVKTIKDIKTRYPEKKIIAVSIVSGPTIMSEYEPYCDAIILASGNLNQAILEAITGEFCPSGLLPYDIPANMEVVEKQCEDTPFDMECYKDSEGSVYEFGHGLSFDGKIEDNRTRKYKRKRSS